MIYGHFRPRRHLRTAARYRRARDNWAPLPTSADQGAMAGNWKTGSVWWGIKEHMVQLAPFWYVEGVQA